MMPVLDEELKTNEWVNLGIPVKGRRHSLGSAEETWNNTQTRWIADSV